MQERHLNKALYFGEQEYTTNKHVIPYISEFVEIGEGFHVLEIGCGEGGNLKPFLDAGCHATGVDLSESKIEEGRKLFAGHPQAERLTLICDDIYNLRKPDRLFDFIFLRDVIEHIHNQERFMQFVKELLAPWGTIFFAFPPWQNPFGGHQQVCKNRILSHLPWTHLLPRRLYARLLKLGGENPQVVEGLLEVKQTGISIERFERIVRNEEYHILKKTYFAINPNYEIKFGLKPRRLPRFFSSIPRLRNFMATAACYLISPNEKQDVEI
ncbi:MAG: class I SAM-dependent methyltransferase [Prolixibacteraceae bacterium]|nr:class I SAM-dependent methyltransferase [Prolixibacteraceae bacterium]